MAKQASVGWRLGMAFAVLSALMVINTARSVTGIGRLLEQARANMAANRLRIGLLELEVRHMAWADGIRNSISEADASRRQELNPAAADFSRWLQGREREEAEGLVPELREYFRQVDRCQKLLWECAVAHVEWKRNAEGRTELGATRDSSRDGELTQRLQDLCRVLDGARGVVQNRLGSDQNLLISAKRMRVSVALIGSTAILGGILWGFVARRRIVRSLHQSVDILSSTSERVGSSCTELQKATTKASRDAETQSGSIHEMLDSLTAMAQSTRQNAENAAAADGLMIDANASLSEGVEEVKHLAKAVERMGTAATNMGTIIRTIDEIAFRTNLISLNAAVEAARAGRAGDGFGVVAREVRQLSLQSAEAAKQTAELIGELRSGADNGVTVANAVAARLEATHRSAADACQSMSGIAVSSREQAQQISQATAAMQQMAEVVQEGAASTQESAAMVTVLTRQERNLSQVVGELKALMGTGAQRQEELRSLARRAADTVASTHQAVLLPSMPGLDRQVIHQVLSDDPRVTTESLEDDSLQDGHKRIRVAPAGKTGLEHIPQQISSSRIAPKHLRIPARTTSTRL